MKAKKQKAKSPAVGFTAYEFMGMPILRDSSVTRPYIITPDDPEKFLMTLLRQTDPKYAPASVTITPEEIRAAKADPIDALCKMMDKKIEHMIDDTKEELREYYYNDGTGKVKE